MTDAPPVGRLEAWRKRLGGIRGQLATTIVAEALTFVVGITTSILVNRHLLPAGKGLLASTLSLVGITYVITMFGLSKSFLYFFNREGSTKGEVMASAFALWRIGAIAGLGILVTLLLRANSGPDRWGIVVLAGMYLLGQQWQDLLSGALRAARVIHVLNGARVVQQVLRLGIIAGLAVWGGLSFPSALAAETFVLLGVVSMLAVTFYRRPDLRPRSQRPWPLASEMLKYGIAYQMFSVLWNVHLKLDVVLTRSWSGDAAAGVYATAVNLADMLQRGPTMLLFVTSPYLAQIRSEQASVEYALRNCRMAFPFFVVGGAILAAVAPWLVEFLYGAEFRAAAGPLRIFLPATVAAGMFMLIVSHLVVRGEFRILLVLQSFALALNVALNYALIPRYAASGAAMAATISHCLSFLAILTYLQRRYGIDVRRVFVATRSEWQALLPAHRPSSH